MSSLMLDRSIARSQENIISVHNLAIDLSSIRDDMTNNEEGFSFVLYPGNKLDTAYLELCCRASRAHRHGLLRGGDWEWNAIFQYFKKDEALRAAILGGMFYAGGQLPRCMELLSLLCSNGELHPRGIYIYITGQ